jgi:Outer membrane protein beta-barrel domain
MKSSSHYKGILSLVLLAVFILLNNSAIAQVDTTKPIQADTATAQAQKEKKKKDEFIIYGGINANNLSVADPKFDADGGLGYHLGVAYKRGKFFYWQVGARYNRQVYNLVSTSTAADTSKLTVNAIDVPLTAGINFLSFANRVVALRVFVSAVPSFNIGVGDNDVNVTKDDINSFVMYGQAGIGVDVAFVLVEAGYNYGFNDLLKNYSNSNPGQAFVSVGFRF